MNLKTTLLLLLITITFKITYAQEKGNNDKITVLNYATFHLSNTTDANSSLVDINNPTVRRDVNKIVQKLVEFEPTIICVEIPKKNSEGINEIYQEYKIDQSNTTNWSEEINSIAFEVGRLSGVEKIYGIDYKLGFDYPKLMQLAKESDSDYNKEFLKQNSKDIQEFNDLSLLGKFQIMNTEEWRSETINFYNFLATMQPNGKLEGVEIISNFYKRNLAIYSNFANIKKDKNDRVLIIFGGTHSAYLDLFLENNPNINLIDPNEFVVQ
ncbi:DUF5694 domain-containing protein [uncultured Christiangramia sp.]|uniref:DUF5694 domain-containing protein n=1 Tax=Christiangramia sp. 3-2217-3z TaxID=3417564 RepID=UPI002622B872|nr:DUF5694 domain-containing protein [uncultured Christiangramia sp.]